MTVTAQLMGGLGNQLFQIFHVIALALERKAQDKPFDFKLPNSKTLYNRHTYWDTFLSPLKKYTTDPKELNYPVIGEKSFSYNKINTNLVNFKIYGYFQSYKYVQDYMQKIKELIHFDSQQSKVKEDYKSYFSGKPTVSVHFRLGDYKTYQHCHPIMPIEYYINALANLAASTQNQQMDCLYFCEKEDNNTVNKMVEQLKEKIPHLTFIKVADSIVDWQQLLLMTLCDYKIIANSSFSWWGAYFTGGTVYYPAKWFGPGLKDKDVSDMCPLSWTKVGFN